MDILLASHNQHKYQEIKAILKATKLNLLSLSDLNDHDEVEETGQSFEENAYLKANYYYQKYHMPVIADDSGLVTSLDGKPGIFSSRYSGLNATDLENNLKLLFDLKNITDRSAYFICVICFIFHDQVYYFTGKLTGKIAYDMRGEEGFGYDPLFILPDGSRLSELKIQEKNKISHRSQALNQWFKFLEEEGIK